jgi:hypothetical protein
MPERSRKQSCLRCSMAELAGRSRERRRRVVGLAWQVYDKDGQPTAERGTSGACPLGGLATVVAAPSGEFTVLY